MSTDVKAGIGTWAKKSCSDTAGYICLRNVGEWVKQKKSFCQVLCRGRLFAYSLHCPSPFPPVGGTQIFKRKRWSDLILPSTDPLIPENSKPTTRTSYVPVINDTFRVNTQEMTWNAAKSFCENDGATLASLRNEWAKSYSHMMSLNLNAPLWIGLNRKAVWHRDPLITQSSITGDYKPLVW